jgi:adenylosuccinate lyase
VLLALVAAGMQRDEAYRIVQERSQRSVLEGVHLRKLLADRPELDLDAVFDYGAFTRHAEEIVARLDALAQARAAV